MPRTIGQLAEASHYNSVAEIANKVFGDIYSSAAVTDNNRKATHKYGWGATNVDQALSAGTPITADKLQVLVNHTNVSIDHINVTDSVLVFTVPTNRTNITAQTLVRAEDLNLIEDKFNNTILATNNHGTVDSDSSSLLTATPLSGGPYTRTATWQNKITAEHKWTWGSYNAARYFFNGGGTVNLDLEMSGGCTAGYFNWADMVNEMGVLVLNWDTVTQSASTTAGHSFGKGFYDLTQYYGDGSDAGTTDEGLLFQSSGVTQNTAYGYGYGYGYGSAGLFVSNADSAYLWAGRCDAGPNVYLVSQSGYSGYASRAFKLYGKYAANGAEVHLKAVLDNTTLTQVVDGTIEATNKYLMPDIITQSTSTFDVTPDPTLTILDNFNSGDDS